MRNINYAVGKGALTTIALVVAAVIVAIIIIGEVSAKKDEPKEDEVKKVFVCKYVGTPGEDERLQTGQNPINVSINSIKDYKGVESFFNDEHGRSYVLAEDTGQEEPDVKECPEPDNEEPEEPEEPEKPVKEIPEPNVGDPEPTVQTKIPNQK